MERQLQILTTGHRLWNSARSWHGKLRGVPLKFGHLKQWWVRITFTYWIWNDITSCSLRTLSNRSTHSMRRLGAILREGIRQYYSTFVWLPVAFTSSFAKGGKFGESNAARVSAETFLARFPRNRLLSKKTQTWNRTENSLTPPDGRLDSGARRTGLSRELNEIKTLLLVRGRLINIKLRLSY